MRGQARSARAVAWNKRSRADEFRARCVGARGTVFTLTQPGSLIKKSNKPLRASKRPIPEPLFAPHQIPFAPSAAEGAA